MTYNEFIDKLDFFGWSHIGYGIENGECYHWFFNHSLKNITATIKYIIDNNINPDIVSLNVVTNGNQLIKYELRYQECINLIINREYVKTDILRDIKLNRLDI
jgi:hypothetical protein